MSENKSDRFFEDLFARLGDGPDRAPVEAGSDVAPPSASSSSTEPSTTRRAPSRLRSRIYTAMIREQQASGPLESVKETKAAGHKLCVFEELVQIAPVGETLQRKFPCHICHARKLAEAMEHPPIWWPHCPYAEFKNS